MSYFATSLGAERSFQCNLLRRRPIVATSGILYKNNNFILILIKHSNQIFPAELSLHRTTYQAAHLYLSPPHRPRSMLLLVKLVSPVPVAAADQSLLSSPSTPLPVQLYTYLDSSAPPLPSHHVLGARPR